MYLAAHISRGTSYQMLYLIKLGSPSADCRVSASSLTLHTNHNSHLKIKIKTYLYLTGCGAAKRVLVQGDVAGLHCKKMFFYFSVPSLEVTYQNSPWTAIIKFFSSRESLVSDLPTGDGKIDNLFLQCK